jgi:hypothetical protein
MELLLNSALVSPPVLKMELWLISTLKLQPLQFLIKPRLMMLYLRKRLLSGRENWGKLWSLGCQRLLSTQQIPLHAVISHDAWLQPILHRATPYGTSMSYCFIQ